MKTYIITLSKVFLKGHPREGQATDFKFHYQNGNKIHTIRKGEYWRKVVKEVNEGKAILSVREWSGKPYNSKQIEIGRHERLGWQAFEIKGGGRIFIDGFKNAGEFSLRYVASNDGLRSSDFQSWFNFPKNFNGGIIHFTDFRY